MSGCILINRSSVGTLAQFFFLKVLIFFIVISDKSFHDSFVWMFKNLFITNKIGQISTLFYNQFKMYLSHVSGATYMCVLSGSLLTFQSP